MPEKKDLESKETEDETPAQTAPTEEKNEDAPEGEADTSKNTEEGESTEGSAENDNQESGVEDIDYKTELEVETARREKAEEAIIKLKKKRKESGEVEPLSETQVGKIVQDSIDRSRLDDVEDYVDTQVELITQNVDEQKLIRFHYDNSVKKSGFSKRSIRKDLENAQAIANRKRILKENRELKTSLSQGSASNTGMGSNQSKPRTGKPKLSEADKTFLRQRGKNPDNYEIREGGVVSKI